jgi:hypothetical protein
VRVLGLVALLVLVGCGGAEERRTGDGGTRIAGYGLEITIPDGWHGEVTKAGPHDAAQLRAATFPLGEPTGIGHSAQRTMGASDVLVVVSDYGPPLASWGEAERRPTSLPVRVGREHVVSFEGFLEPVATVSAVVGGHALQLWVVTSTAPTAAQLAQANRVLATLRVEDGLVRFRDDEVGLSGAHPRGWHALRSLTRLSEPREVLALASYPLRAGAEAGECAPDTARVDMPAGGVFVWLLEYVEQLPPERFPERPARFSLERDRLVDHIRCFPGPGWTTTFRLAGRQLQLLVAFGGPPSADRLRDVEELLNSLAFEPR